MADRGRPRSFDRQTALCQAMKVFWAKGYDDASLTDLTQAMGIASPSLYAAFGGKEALFHEAVELYQATVGLEIWGDLESEADIADAIGAFLMNTARAYARPGDPPGCLIVLGAKAAPRDPDPIGQDLRDRRMANADRLRRRFERAVAQGQVRPDLDCAATADFYATLQNGMSILARDGADAAAIEAVARLGVQALAPILATSPGSSGTSAPSVRPRR